MGTHGIKYNFLAREMVKFWKFFRLLFFPMAGLGIFYLIFKDRPLDEVVHSLKRDFDYRFIALSLVVGVLSHWVRALRWRMLMTFEGREPSMTNVFGAVWIGYLANLVLPRMGEVSKCGVVSKYEKLSFARVAGTVVVERLADLAGMVVILLAVWILEYALLREFVSRFVKWPSLGMGLGWWMVVLAVAAGLMILGLGYKYIRRGMWLKFREMVQKFAEGTRSYAQLPQKGLFVVYSILIWVFYFFMLYIPFFSLHETSALTPLAALTVLVTGSLGMLVPIQGGVGPWHFMVIQTLVLYGVVPDAAGNFALVVHTSQNLLIVAVGLLFFLLLPILNRKRSV